MQYTFIVNPTAGRNTAGKKRRLLEAILRTLGVRFDIRTTEAPAHATELAIEAADRSDAVVAVGGDGTVQEVSRGIVASGKPVHLGVIPAGTGNDFVKMLGTPLPLERAVQSLVAAEPFRVDYGRVRCFRNGSTYEGVFVNAVGVGLDAAVAHRASGYKRLPGIASYGLSAVRTLAVWPQPKVRIETIDSGGQLSTVYEGPLTLACTGNGISSGGGFLLTPGAVVNDGLLDLCIAEGVPFLRAMQLLPMALRGRHVQAPEIHIHRVQGLRLTSDTGIPVHVDGEYLTSSAFRIEIEIVPEGLSVLAPPAHFVTT